MRDFRRIEKITGLIRAVWKSYPDLRLMQLLINAISYNQNYNVKEPTNPDDFLHHGKLYHLEDDKLEEIIKNYMRDIDKGEGNG